METQSRANERRRTLVARQRKDVLSLFGNQCRYCGFKDERALQLDHIFGGGNKEWTRIKHDRAKFYREILDGRYDKTKLQLLCANCNWIKRYENNELLPIKVY